MMKIGIVVAAHLGAAGAGQRLRDRQRRSDIDELARIVDLAADIDPRRRERFDHDRHPRILQLLRVGAVERPIEFRHRAAKGQFVARDGGRDPAVGTHRDLLVQFRIQHQPDREDVADLHAIRRRRAGWLTTIGGAAAPAA